MNELFVNAAEVGGDTALSKTETTCSHGSPCYSHQSLICSHVGGRDVCAWLPLEDAILCKSSLIPTCFQQLLQQGSTVSVTQVENKTHTHTHTMQPNLLCGKVHCPYVPFNWLILPCANAKVIFIEWLLDGSYLFKNGSELLVVMLRASCPMLGEDTGFWVPPSCSMLVGSWFLRASSCKNTHKRKNVCQSVKFIKWADWVCRNGSLTQDKMNDFLWNYSKYWDEQIHFLLLKEKGQNKLYWFLHSNYTHVRETVSELWKGKKLNLTYKFYLSFLYHPLEPFSSNKSWVTNLVVICQWIV